MKADNTDITGAESLAEQQEAVLGHRLDARAAIKDKYPGVQLQQYDTYSACVEALKNGAVDAVTTDEVILAGYAAQSPGTFKIVGEPFSEEKLRHRPEEGRHRAAAPRSTTRIKKMESDGAWKAAFDKNLGPAGITTPTPPTDRRTDGDGRS